MYEEVSVVEEQGHKVQRQQRGRGWRFRGKKGAEELYLGMEGEVIVGVKRYGLEHV